MKIHPTLLRLFDLLFLLLLAAFIFAGVSLVPFHGDEATLIYMSHDYDYQFLQRDLSLVQYSNPPISAQEQDLRLLNGTVNKYLIGLAWHIGGFTADDLNEQWDWGGDWNYNRQNNHAPSEALLLVARIPSTLLLVVGMVAIFALGWQLGGRPVAYLAALFYALHPVLLLNGRRAMMEGSFIAFSLLTLLAAVWWLKMITVRPNAIDSNGSIGADANLWFVRPASTNHQQLMTWLVSIAFGIAAGLALASKHTALFTVAAVFGGCGVWVFIEPQKNEDRNGAWHDVPLRLSQLILAGVIALTVFYILNPAWWGDPMTRAGQVLERRQELLTEQTAFFGGYDGLGDAFAGFLRQAFIAQPQYYEAPGWESYIGDQIASYEASPLRGVTIGGSVIGVVMVVILVVIGFWALLRDRTIPASTRWVVGFWALAMFVTTALLTPIEWQRYYLPVYPAIGLLVALGIWWITKTIRRIWLKNG
jgi:4-amino-4-deoxy-L-arabinose transferase-like glycosyltransferase